MAKKSMSELLRQKASARAQEMVSTKRAIETGQSPKKVGRQSDGEPRRCVSISLRESSHKQLKMYAVSHDTSASALIEKWIAEYCVD